MSVETAADRAGFVHPDEFGAEALYTPAGGAPVAVTGIFDDGFATAFDGPGLATSLPTFTMPSADLPHGAATGDRLAVAGSVFAVRIDQDDGTGMTVLQLEEVDQ